MKQSTVLIIKRVWLLLFFFFNDTATTEIYTLSLHDALPICCHCALKRLALAKLEIEFRRELSDYGLAKRSCIRIRDRKSTRLNSSHSQISYAVFCLKKKKKSR